MAKNGWDLLGSWCGHGKDTDVEMLYDGLTAEFGGEAELRYAMGCNCLLYTSKDENKINAISPVAAEQQVTDGAMEAKIKGIDNAGSWVIPEDGQYRVCLLYTSFESEWKW